MAALRTFFALELGGDARRAAFELARALREGPGGEDLRWVREESLHVTLRFLGATGSDDVPELLRAVGDAVGGQAPFELGLAGLRAFPSPRRPRVVALGLEPEAPVAALAAAVERGVRAAGWPAETRDFRPHVTLGRLRRGRKASADLVTASVTPAREAWEVRDVVLFQSQLSTEGARHAPLGRISLHP